ncbi:phycobilisome linker polypeptide [Lyngbya confervoides]|uniref:Phycobilisome linker polypeptide n=1 Tax=Lyngbya confervoides BDU141951 TaxID=1574623 RepID=A0ABD4T761_9CYAN|nr:phycobilisome linker polypeptide [Lyngbya confervoides]MCM1984311.1 phycobilisome linker polypeptide [Lyngbya confervoides BDU141951]
MLSPAAFYRGSSTTVGNRMYVYEVSGLGNYDPSQVQGYSIRESGTCYVQVPYSQMNQTMRRLQKLGGKIVSIQPLESFQPSQAGSGKTEEVQA